MNQVVCRCGGGGRPPNVVLSAYSTTRLVPLYLSYSMRIDSLQLEERSQSVADINVCTVMTLSYSVADNKLSTLSTQDAFRGLKEHITTMRQKFDALNAELVENDERRIFHTPYVSPSVSIIKLIE